MNPTELRHFGLRTVPFTKEIADADLWLPSSKAELVERLADAIAARESILLDGDSGAGKTCVLRALRHRLGPSAHRLTYCSNVTLGRRDFYRQLCAALGLSTKATAAAVFAAISADIENLSKDKTHPVFILDEAHLIHQDVLDHLHILMNFDWDSQALLSLVLVGLPELGDRLRLRRNSSLYSRLHHRFTLEPLAPEDTAEYLSRRLDQAGAKSEIITADAIALIHEAASGHLRDVDRLATRALRVAARTKSKLVERHHLLEITKENDL